MRLGNFTTLNEIARERRMNYHTLRYWLNKAKVPQKKVGTVIFIKKNDVKKIIAAGSKAKC